MPVLMNLSSPPLLPQHDHLSSPLSFTTTPPQLSLHYPPHIHHLSPPVKLAPIPLKFSPSHISSHTPPVHIVRDSTIVCSRNPAYQETSSSPPPIQIEPIHQNESIPPPHATVHTLPHIAHPSLNPLRKLIARGLDAIENTFIASLEKQHPLPSTTDPRIQLTGNFFPVPENAVQHELEVEGEIPSSLEGMYVRNGANPMFKPVAGHHLFDGDGMLHAVRFKQGIVSYANRFTRTHRLQEEEKLGRALFPKAVGELHGHSGLARLMLFYARSAFGLIDGSKGMGVANAGVVFFNGHLLAMSEDDLPYAVNITSAGDLSTIGRYNFNGQLASSMIAHPKVDAKTGELFVLSYDVLKKPYLKYFKFCADGNKCPEVTISVKEPTMMHDFAITENHVVIPDQQVVFRLQEMMSGGSPVVHAKEKMPRFGLLPRDAEDESAMVWVDVPNCFCFHLWNAWEEGDEVVVIASCMTPPDSIFNESSESLRSILSEIRLNKATKTSTRRALISSINLEAGQVNGNFLGRRSQFAYLAIAEPWPKCSGIAKVDLLKGSNHNSLHCADGKDGPCTEGKDGPCIDGKEGQDDPCIDGEEGTCNIGYSQTWPQSDEHHIVTKFMYPSDCYGGEPMFVPRSSDPSAPEDDGYVLSFMHNEKTDKSELLILDASSPSLEMVARVKLPSRVPYGFHGTFITAEELEHQKVG